MAGHSTDPVIYTTGQIAKLVKVAPRTVSKWYDSGKLRGYRIPGSQDRRIPRADLVEFLRANGMPIPADLDDRVGHAVLAVAVDGTDFGTGLPTMTPFEYGRAAQEHTLAARPAALAVVLTARDGMDVCLRLAKEIRAADDRPMLLLIVGDDAATTGTFGVIDKLVGESAVASVKAEADALLDQKDDPTGTRRKMHKSPTYGKGLAARHGNPKSLANLKHAPSHQKKENDRVEAE